VSSETAAAATDTLTNAIAQVEILNKSM